MGRPDCNDYTKDGSNCPYESADGSDKCYYHTKKRSGLIDAPPKNRSEELATERLIREWNITSF